MQGTVILKSVPSKWDALFFKLGARVATCIYPLDRFLLAECWHVCCAALWPDRSWLKRG